jgi:hypothetical protein
MATYNTLENANDYALVDDVVFWWSKTLRKRVKRHGWNAYLVTFMFNHIPGGSTVKLKMMQDSMCRFYSTLLTRVVRNPNSLSQLFNRPIMMAVPDYPVYKHKKVSLQDAKINDGLHFHALLAVPSESRLKQDVGSHVQQYSGLYVKAPIQRIHVDLIEAGNRRTIDYAMKSVKRQTCRWEDVLVLPKSPCEFACRSDQYKWLASLLCD